MTSISTKEMTMRARQIWQSSVSTHLSITTPGSFPISPDADQDFMLTTEEGTLLRYEEPRANATPMSELVTGLRFRTASGCTTTPLEAAALAGASVRDNDRHRWTVRVTEELLRSEGCSLSPEVPPDGR
jgi:hypothetical protein